MLFRLFPPGGGVGKGAKHEKRDAAPFPSDEEITSCPRPKASPMAPVVTSLKRSLGKSALPVKYLRDLCRRP